MPRSDELMLSVWRRWRKYSVRLTKDAALSALSACLPAMVVGGELATSSVRCVVKK